MKTYPAYKTTNLDWISDYPRTPYRILCNGVKRECVKATPVLASRLFCDSALHKIRYGIYPSHWQLKRLKYLVRLVNENASENNMLRKIALENIESYSGKLINLDSEIEFTDDGKSFDKGDIL